MNWSYHIAIDEFNVLYPKHKDVNECIQVLMMLKEQDCFKSKFTRSLNSRSRER